MQKLVARAERGRPRAQASKSVQGILKHISISVSGVRTKEGSRSREEENLKLSSWPVREKRGKRGRSISGTGKSPADLVAKEECGREINHGTSKDEKRPSRPRAGGFLNYTSGTGPGTSKSQDGLELIEGIKTREANRRTIPARVRGWGRSRSIRKVAGNETNLN